MSRITKAADAISILSKPNALLCLSLNNLKVGIQRLLTISMSHECATLGNIVVQRINATEFIIMTVSNSFDIVRSVININLISKDLVILIFNKHLEYLGYIGEELRNNREVAAAVVNKNGMALNWASAFNDDREIVRVALIENINAFMYASDRLKTDRSLLLNAISKCNIIFDLIPENIKKDRQIALAAVRKCPIYIFSFDTQFLDDDEIVSAAFSDTYFAKNVIRMSVNADHVFNHITFIRHTVRTNKSWIFSKYYHEIHNFKIPNSICDDIILTLINPEPST